MLNLKIHLGRGCIVTLDNILENEKKGLMVEYTVLRKGTLSNFQIKKSFSCIVSCMLEQAVVSHNQQKGVVSSKQWKRLQRRQKWMDKNVFFVLPH